MAELPPLYTDRAKPPTRTEDSRVRRTAQSACGGISTGYCEYIQTLLSAFVQNIEISKISLKYSKTSKNQKMQKNRLANHFDMRYNKLTAMET